MFSANGRNKSLVFWCLKSKASSHLLCSSKDYFLCAINISWRCSNRFFLILVNIRKRTKVIIYFFYTIGFSFVMLIAVIINFLNHFLNRSSWNKVDPSSGSQQWKRAISFSCRTATNARCGTEEEISRMWAGGCFYVAGLKEASIRRLFGGGRRAATSILLSSLWTTVRSTSSTWWSAPSLGGLGGSSMLLFFIDFDIIDDVVVLGKIKQPSWWGWLF